MKAEQKLYLCNKCFSVTTRESARKRIPSYCTETKSHSTMTRIDNADQLAIKLRKQFLGGAVDLSTFKKSERERMEVAFEQGVIVLFNRLKITF